MPRKSLNAHRICLDGDPRALIAEIASRSAASASILMVGHEPSLSQLIPVLVSGDERTLVTMKKAGLCKLAAQTLRYGRCASLSGCSLPLSWKESSKSPRPASRPRFVIGRQFRISS